MTEQTYQQQFVENILNGKEQQQAGDKIYRNNWLENAHRALAVSFPTVQALLGDDNFRAIARQCCESIPKTQYDWGQWCISGEFAELIIRIFTAQGVMASLDYVVDCAQLDAAIFQCQRSIDPMVNEASFALLSGESAETSVLATADNIRFVDSYFPLHNILDYVREKTGNSSTLNEQILKAREQKSITPYVVYRQSFRPLVLPYSMEHKQLLLKAKQGSSVADLFETAETLKTDFAAWLGDAIAKHLIVAAQ